MKADKPRKPFLNIDPQIWAAISINVGAFILGTACSWSSPVLPHISECANHCDIPDIGIEMGSWVGSSLIIGGILAGPSAGILLDKLGRKKTFLFLPIPTFIGYFILSLTLVLKNVYAVLIGRALVGFGAGASILAIPIYLSETAEAGIQPLLMPTMIISMNAGMLMVQLLNLYQIIHWIYITHICTGLCVIMFALALTIPESPAYLIVKDKRDEAIKVLKYLRCGSEIVEELKSLELSMAFKRSYGSIGLKDLFIKREYRCPFLIGMCTMIIQQFSGINFIIFYAQSIVEKSGVALDATVCSLMIIIFQNVGSLLGIMLGDKFPRKIVLVTSAFFMAITVSGLATYSFIQENEEIFAEGLVQNLWLLPILALLFFVLSFSSGIYSIPWILNAELYVPEAQGLCSSIGYVVNWFCAWVIIKYALAIQLLINFSGIYFAFAGVSLFGSIFFTIFVPEVSGKTPEEMKKMFA